MADVIMQTHKRTSRFGLTAVEGRRKPRRYLEVTWKENFDSSCIKISES